MSGICGLVQLDGVEVDRERFHGWSQHLHERGPDGLGAHVEPRAALATSLLRTVDGLTHVGPITLDGIRWIAADARIDDQHRLRSELRGRGIPLEATATDAELILHAYEAWGVDCPRHLLGDFAFAIWDSRRRSLYAARDPLGVKPFFYSRTARRLAFSNDFPTILLQADAGIDEMAIADFLVFEMNRDPESTSFASVRRLPPAHWLRLDGEGLAKGRYWSLPLEPTVRRRRDPRDYVEGFREVLREAVRDRVRTERVCVHMSGGLDSPAVAASLVECSPSANVAAHTAVYDRLFADDERRFAQAAAAALRIPVEFHAGDGYALYERHSELAALSPEPVNRPLAAFEIDLARHAARHGRVALTGWDGDTIMAESPRPYFRHLLGEGSLGRLAREGARYALAERKLLPSGTLRRLAGIAPKPDASPFPEWLDPEFERRLALRERARSLGDVMPRGSHPLRPQASRVLDYIARRSNFFDAYDPGFTGAAVEFRHPMLDLRVVDYCLTLPTFPWCVRKHVLRSALQGTLPHEVLSRPKTPLAGFPFMEILKDERSKWIDDFTPCEATLAYVNRAKIPLTRGDADPESAWRNLRPLALDMWIRDARPTGLHP